MVNIIIIMIIVSTTKFYFIINFLSPTPSSLRGSFNKLSVGLIVRLVVSRAAVQTVQPVSGTVTATKIIHGCIKVFVVAGTFFAPSFGVVFTIVVQCDAACVAEG